MIESFNLIFPGTVQVARRAHVGVVSSGDLEVLLEPATAQATIAVTTKVAGHRKTWEAVLSRFFERNAAAVTVEISDHGATPGTVWLRLEQALELARREPGE